MRLLKESIAYSQTPPVKRICSTNSEFEVYINMIKDQSVKRGYGKIVEKVQKVKKVEVKKVEKFGIFVFFKKNHHGFNYQSLITGHFRKHKKYTSTTLAPIKNKTNIGEHISTKQNTSR